MSAARKHRTDDAEPFAHASSVREAIFRLAHEAGAFCAPRKVEETIRQWLAHARPVAESSDAEMLLAEASALALELGLYAPSISGVRPVDRLARQFKAETADERIALECLRRAKFTLFCVTAPAREAVYQARDLATGRSFLLFEDRFAPEAVGLDIAGRICPLDGDLHVSVGPTIAIDGELGEMCRAFIRPGRGLVNDQRCAALLYRDYLRRARGGGLDFGLIPAETPFALSHPDEELDSLASDWAEFGQGSTPTGDALIEARNMTSGRRVLAALHSCVELRGAGKSRLAEIYRSLAAIQMETLHRRALAGSGESDPLEILRAALETHAALKRTTSEAFDLFRDLSRPIRSLAGSPSGRREDLGRVIERIRGLRAKTTDQGCSEQEALAAAAKVAEMLERYGLSLSEIEFRRQTCEGLGIDTGRRRHAHADRCVPAVADFCDCRHWSETSAQGTLRFVFFGLPADVEAAHYLYDVVAAAFDTETATFRRGAVYRDMVGAGKRAAVASFEIGLAQGIVAKLAKLKAERQAATLRSTGRDLVPIKASILDEEFGKLGLALHSKRLKRRRKIISAAFEEGHAAGRKFELRAGIK